MHRKYRQAITAFFLAVFAGFFFIYAALNDSLENLRLLPPMLEQKPMLEAETVSQNQDLKVYYRYLLCGHTVPGALPAGVHYTGPGSLRNQLAEEQGWVVKERNGTVEAVKYTEGFCPEDAAKTHLGAVGDLIAVFQGPPGINTNIIEVTDIPIANLPLEWQEQVRLGELDFDSVKKLKETLDSLDEYR